MARAREIRQLFIYLANLSNRYNNIIDIIFRAVEKIFVCHHAPLEHRKKYLSNFFIAKQIDVEWVESFTPEEISNHYEKLVGKEDLSINTNAPGIQQGQYKLYKNAGKKVSIAELSLYLKHQYCFEQQIKKEYKTIVILEDDVMLPDNFKDYLKNCYLEFINHEPKLDCIMLGSCFDFKSSYIKQGRLVHYGPNQLTRCTHAMMFSLDAATKIMSHLYPVNWPIDFKLNEIIVKEDLKVGWTEPSLQQASQIGKEKSSIQQENIQISELPANQRCLEASFLIKLKNIGTNVLKQISRILHKPFKQFFPARK